MEKVTTKELADFLNEANKSTYANKDAPKASSTRLKSEDYHFEKGNLIYHDTYFGARDFMGEEIVYKDKVPVWGMNYYGFVLDDNFTEKQVYDFLKKALLQDCPGIIPVRGPQSYPEEDFEYKNYPDGNLDNFTGKEEILFGGKATYRCFYHGGFIR